MKINRDNYEIFFLDYRENQLNPVEMAELLVFLEQHPDLKEEFERFEIISITKETMSFNKKSALKKPELVPVVNIDESNYDNYFIAALEGDLKDNEAKDIDLFLEKNSFLKKEYDQYQQTVSTPDTDIVFANKDSLKKRFITPETIRVITYITSAAAVLLLFFSLFTNQDQIQNNDLLSLSDRSDLTVQRSIAVSETKEPILIAENKTIVRPLQSTKAAVITPIIPERETMILTKIPTRQYESIASLQTEAIKIMPHRVSQATVFSAPEIETALIAEAKPDNNEYLTLGQFVTTRVKKVLTGNKQQETSPEKLSAWSIADIGVNGMNRIATNYFSHSRKKNEDGKIVAYSFAAGNLSFSRSGN